jgi:hypothetical protein
MRRWSTLLLVTVLSACAPAQASLGADDTQPAASSRTIVVAPGTSARVDGTPLSITLEAIVDDSRCAEGVTCIWAGDVGARISIGADRATPEEATLHLMVAPHDVTHGDVRITLVSVTPYPKADQKIDPESYRATFRIDAK